MDWMRAPLPFQLRPMTVPKSTRGKEMNAHMKKMTTMVPKGTARVRVITSASFSKEDCDKGLEAFRKVKEELM